MPDLLSLPPLLQSCVDFIAHNGWREFSLQAMVTHTGLPLSHIQASFSKREDVLTAFFEAVSQHIAHELQGIEKRKDEDAFQEQLLESLMVRFEIFQRYRPFVVRLYEESLTLPCLGMTLLRGLLHSLEKTLYDLHLNPSWDLMAPLLWIYGRGFQTWLRDDSADLSKTLFMLDQCIKKLSPFFTPHFQ